MYVANRIGLMILTFRSKAILFVFGLLLCNGLFGMDNHSYIDFNKILSCKNYMCSTLVNCMLTPSEDTVNLNCCNLFWCNIQGNQKTMYLNSCTLIGVDIDSGITIENNSSLIMSKNTVKK